MPNDEGKGRREKEKFPRSPSRFFLFPSPFSLFHSHFLELSLAIALLVFFLVLAGFAPAFFRKQHLLSVLCAAVPVLIVASGMAVVIICRQIDVSVGSQFALCSILLGLLVRANWPVPAAALATLALGAAFGALNG